MPRSMPHRFGKELEGSPRHESSLIPEDIHERGGLTPQHWKIVLDRLGQSPLLDSTSIRDYAAAVIHGEFSDINFHHREYLGSRHWKNINTAFADEKPFLVPHRRRPWSRNEYPSIVNDIVDYALLEEHATYTLNDYIHSDMEPTIKKARRLRWEWERESEFSGRWSGEEVMFWNKFRWVKREYATYSYPKTIEVEFPWSGPEGRTERRPNPQAG